MIVTMLQKIVVVLGIVMNSENRKRVSDVSLHVYY